MAPVYIPIPYHRNRSPQKSQWLISTKNELDLFITAFNSLWLSKCKTRGWGVIKDNSTFIVVGKSVTSDDLHIAKFIGNGDNWHGYPADIAQKAQDIPEGTILSLWISQSILSKSDASRISRGIPCFH